MQSKLLILSPYPNKTGGVINFVNALKGRWDAVEIYHYRGGSSKHLLFSVIHLIYEYVLFVTKLFSARAVFINTSLNLSAFNRDEVYARLCHYFNCDYTVFIHGWDDQYFANHKIELKKSKLLQAKIIYVLSNDFAACLLSIGVPSERVVIERTAIDEVLVDSFKNINKTFSGAINMLFLGRLEASKGIYIVLDVFLNLAKFYPNINLDIVGSGSEDEKVIRWLNSNDSSRITYHGRLEGEKKLNIYRKAHFYILPTSHNEGLPISVLEAVASGCIVFSTSIGGLGDFFKTHNVGYVITNNAKETESALKSALENRKHLKLISDSNVRLGQNALGMSHLAKRLNKEI